jgi:hypothetical protein
VIEHLGNCHGELTMMSSLLLSVPFLGVWLRGVFLRRRQNRASRFNHLDSSFRAQQQSRTSCPCGHEGGEQH